MSSRFLVAIALTLWSAGTLLMTGNASAATPLTDAIVQTTRNQVLVKLKKQPFRPAKEKLDKLLPNDALQTGSVSLAELRFNDRSLARIGERALFEFQPGTRDIQLKSGTVLLLIQPKQGRTRVRTPNAAAGIRGSALFVRYIPGDAKTGLGPITIVGALTNSDIEVSNQDESQKYILKAGQMAVVHKNAIGLYTFDLNNFYATSALAAGLDLNQAAGSKANLDQTIADVRAETVDALKAFPISATTPTPTTQQIAANPAWIMMSPPTAEVPQATGSATNSFNPLPNIVRRGGSGIFSVMTAAEMLGTMISTQQGPQTAGSFNPGVIASPPPSAIANPGVITLPPPSATAVNPSIPAPGAAAAPMPVPPEPSRPTPQSPTPTPVIPQPSVQAPPINSAPTPITPPPAAAPLPPTVPVPQPPVVVTPPVTTPPVVVTPPATTPPVVVTPPVTTPPVVVTPPVTTPPVVVTPPVTTPPVVVTPPVTTPPAAPRPTPVTPAVPAVPNPGAGPAVPAIPASPAVNANVTVSSPALDLSPVQPATPATP